MNVFDSLEPDIRLLDKQRGRERLVRAVERLGRVVKIWFIEVLATDGENGA